MAAEVVWSPLVQRDLDDIWEWIAVENDDPLLITDKRLLRFRCEGLLLEDPRNCVRRAEEA